MLTIIQKLNLFCGKIIFFMLIFVCSISQIKAQPSSQFLNLIDGPLSTEHWELVLGDLNDWRVIGGRLQGHLLPPPTVSSYISAVTLKPSLWPVIGNYQFSFNFTPLDEADKNFGVLFNYRQNNKGKILLSFLSFHFINQEVYVETYFDQFVTHKTLLPCSLIPGHTYHFDLIYQKPDFELYINEQLLFSSKDDLNFWPDFLEPGRPLFYLSKGNYEESAAVYSNFYLSFFPQLSVPYFSQLDEAWVSSIYDHSQAFFDPALTIGSSGCALTSAAMLLNYYNYKNFPDDENWPIDLRGKSINPDTLNLWLKNEADGYVGAALVNWLAITRLSSLLAKSASSKSATLEFSYAIYQATTISEQLTADQPVIADLDGHFVLIKGIADSEKNKDGTINDYLINDPISDRSNLDHELTPIKSLRLFETSQTDLSYFLLISPEELDVKLLSGIEKKQLNPIVVKENNLLDSQQDWFLYYWPKPAGGNYLWQFSASDLSKLAIAQLLLYQNDGQVQIFNLADYLARELNLDYSKNQLSELSIKESKYIFLNYHQYLLNYLLKLQTEQWLLGQVHNAARYQNLIEQFLNFYQL